MSATYFKIKKQKGVTIIEAILYVFLLTLITGIIVQILISIGGVYRHIKMTRELESSGTIVMESMLREIRNAGTVVLGGSVLGANPGALALSGADENGDPYEVAFTYSSGKIFISKNGSAPVALTSSSGEVERIIFTRLDNGNTEGVKIELQVGGTVNGADKSEKFYGFSVLRGSY